MNLRKNTASILSAFGFLIILGILLAFKANPSNEEYIAQPTWKNLKVLPQNISKDSLTHLMENYSISLGVKCNYCHVPSKVKPTELDFASDAKIEKEIARGMIGMTNDINAKYFQPHFPNPKPDQVHVVNCVLCHRGTANPEKYLSQMGEMYKTYDPERDNRKEKILEEMQKQ